MLINTCINKQKKKKKHDLLRDNLNRSVSLLVRVDKSEVLFDMLNIFINTAKMAAFIF